MGRHEHSSELAPNVLHADRAETSVRERARSGTQTLHFPRSLAGSFPVGARRAASGGLGPLNCLYQSERVGRRLRAPHACLRARRGGRAAVGAVFCELFISEVLADKAKPDFDVLRAS